MKWLARTGIFPVLFFVLSLSAAPAKDLSAQTLVRAWLPWRTIETEHFRFHYPTSLEAWTKSLAARADAVDTAVARLVGYAPSAKTDVVVDDPYSLSNGSAWPFLNRPVINVWAAPPDPRNDIGEYNDWGRTLLSHEFTHIAHLSRPSRNDWTRRFWEFTAVDLGPITLNAPRWVIEGYATFAEGKVTGSGRPHGSWRPAYLRQWALEGQLPRYDQLNTFGSFDGGEFAYLAGSAFLQWLADQHGDSSLVDVWRRMTAKQPRGFDEAFTGVYGESARALYGRFTADLTGKSLEIERTLRAGGFPGDTGIIVQRLSWGTGDPSISRDGKRVVISLASPVVPSRIVIWNTTPEPDTGRARRDSLRRKSDPEDVPARSIYPPPKHALATLRATSGQPYESPRFMRDGRVLVTRLMRMRDGSLRPDLFIWNPRRRTVQRVTRGASIRDGDPSPDGKVAVATKCEHGWCDVTLVDLATGKDSVIASGDPSLSYFRPRFSPSGRRILLTSQQAGRWSLRVIGAPGYQADVQLPFRGNAYDASWLDEGRIVATVDEDGIANLQTIDIETLSPRRLTRVTGAAVAPELNPADSSIWFLSLYSRGYDLRRVPAAASVDSTLVAIDPRLVPAARMPPILVALPDSAPVGPSRPFDLGARLFRWFPLPQADADGATAVLALSTMDIIGRSEIVVKGALGDRAAWRGGAADFTWRGFRPFARASMFDADQVSRRVHMRGGLAMFDETWTSEGWSARGRLGASAATIVDTSARALAFGEIGVGALQRMGISGFSESFSANVSGGRSFDQSFVRGVTSAGVTAFGFLLFPVSASATYGLTSHDAPSFERLSLGGGAPALVDRLLLTQQVTMPALPQNTANGTSAFTYRISLNTQPLAIYFWSGSTSLDRRRFAAWNRVIGLEGSQSVAAIPVAGVPSARVVYGIGESLDAPFRRRVRAYLSLLIN